MYVQSCRPVVDAHRVSGVLGGEVHTRATRTVTGMNVPSIAPVAERPKTAPPVPTEGGKGGAA